jgi:hypothetical protein
LLPAALSGFAVLAISQLTPITAQVLTPFTQATDLEIIGSWDVGTAEFEWPPPPVTALETGAQIEHLSFVIRISDLQSTGEYGDINDRHGRLSIEFTETGMSEERLGGLINLKALASSPEWDILFSNRGDEAATLIGFGKDKPDHAPFHREHVEAAAHGALDRLLIWLQRPDATRVGDGGQWSGWQGIARDTPNTDVTTLTRCDPESEVARAGLCLDVIERLIRTDLHVGQSTIENYHVTRVLDPVTGAIITESALIQFANRGWINQRHVGHLELEYDWHWRTDAYFPPMN